MPRNFGARRVLFGSYWHANDNEREYRWPYLAIGAAVALIVAVGVFA